MTNGWALNYVLYYRGVHKPYFSVGYFRHKTSELSFLFWSHVTKKKVGVGGGKKCLAQNPTEHRERF